MSALRVGHRVSERRVRHVHVLRAGARRQGARTGDALGDELRRIQDESAKVPAGDALSGLEKLLEGNDDPEAFYVSALLCLRFSDLAYLDRNYALPGFMEENSAKIGASMALASKGKDYLCRAAAIAGEAAAQKRETLYIKFMSEIRLRRPADASRTLEQFAGTDSNDVLANYARMVYAVSAGTKSAERLLAAALKANEPNAFYYLAEHLARKGRLAEAVGVLAELGQKADVRISAGLLGRIRDAQAASKV